MNNSQKILLLGANGQLGYELNKSLGFLGNVIATTRQQCDLTDLQALSHTISQIRPNVIINATAYTAVDKAEQDDAQAFKVNCNALAHLAACAKQQKALLIHYSSDYVFDGTKPRAYVETDSTNPLNVYGQSKLSGENEIMRSGAKALIFRTSWVFGSHGNNFVKTVLRLAKEREILSIVDDQIGCPTPAEMLAEATLLALYKLFNNENCCITSPQLYHLTSSEAVSWYDFARYIVQTAKNLGFALKAKTINAIPSSDYPTPAKRPLNSVLDCQKFQKDFGVILPSWKKYIESVLLAAKV